MSREFTIDLTESLGKGLVPATGKVPNSPFLTQCLSLRPRAGRLSGLESLRRGPEAGTWHHDVPTVTWQPSHIYERWPCVELSLLPCSGC